MTKKEKEIKSALDAYCIKVDEEINRIKESSESNVFPSAASIILNMSDRKERDN